MSVLQSIKVVDVADLGQFRDYVFRLLGTAGHREFSEKLCALHTADSATTARLQDEVRGSDEFRRLVQHPAWRAVAAYVLGTDEDDIDIIFPHFRIDLPQVFSADETRMSLPWHQEAGYYLAKGGCTPNSIVLSTYLHDCSSENGALLVGDHSPSDVVEHDEKFMDEENKRFLRVTCPAPDVYREAISRFGETIVFDFMRPHRSGINTSGLVRLTLLLRASSRSEVTHWQATKSTGR